MHKYWLKIAPIEFLFIKQTCFDKILILSCREITVLCHFGAPPWAESAVCGCRQTWKKDVAEDEKSVNK